ncbi:MAG: cyclic dehypoxanthinyl futalosine synthase [candidate division FCPU426 bacterium]
METLDSIYEKCRSGQRLSVEEGLRLYLEAPLIELGDLAHQARLRKVPDNAVSWVADTNLNYTNVCDAYCTFCAFYRTKNAKDAYTYTVPEMISKIKASVSNLGVTTVLIQGGLNPDLPFSYYTDFVSAIRREVPEVHPHLFSAPEIWKMVEVSGKDIRWVLTELHKAGLDTLPGGGAEILTDRVRLKLSKTKVNTENWLKVHETAHELGYRSTATMMFGHLDEPADILASLDAIRQVQDKRHGFTAFIPWSFKPDNTPLGKKMGGMAGVPGPAIYLRILALSRLFLDNFDHIQASWFSEGKKTGQMGLYFGADDFGGTIFEENVLFSANHECKTTYEEITQIIREAGFRPAQRDTKYNIIKYWDEPAKETAAVG